MIVKIDFTSDIPIYMQLRNEIVRLIASDDIKANEKLPSVRRLANELDINHMTVAKTYRLLKDEGFIEIDRRVGARVIDKKHIKDILLSEFNKDIDDLISKMHKLNIDEEQLIDLIKKRMR